jgi:hypothetical protein
VYEVHVSAVYTGNVGATVTVSTPTQSPACGTSFTLGKETLLFVGKDAGQPPARFLASLCRPDPLQSFDVKAVTEQVYGAPKPPDPAAPTASLPADHTVAWVFKVVAGVALVGTVGVAIVWRRRRTA